MALSAKNIRNVVLLGHSGSGKTSMAETMLFESHLINRRGSISEGSTTSDFTLIEKEKGNSLFSTLMHADWRGNKINIIDTPGLDDFVGAVVSSMKVADTAIMAINAKSGVEVGTELIWEYIEKFKTPCIFVVNQMDHDQADFDNALEQLVNRFGPKVLPVQIPVNPGVGFNKIVDALRMVMYEFTDDGGKPEKKDIPEEYMQRAQEMHNQLVEAAAENDENLMEMFFEHGTLNEEELAEGLRIALANQEIYPVFCMSAERNMGSGRLMGFINDIAPSPADRGGSTLVDGSVIEFDQSGPTTAFIYNTMSEPQVGKVSYFKVYSGVLSSGDELVNQANGTTERINQIFAANGKSREQVEEVRAGDIGVTVKLKDSHTNNTLNTKGTNREIEPIHFPEPRIRTAVVPPSKADFEKLTRALNTIVEEDPTLIVEHSPELKQTILHGQGQLHLDIIKYRIEMIHDLKMEFTKPRIPYRETITKLSNGSYRHKKQSGGAGQFAEVHMRIEPFTEGMPEPKDLSVRNKEIETLPSGGKLVYYWCIVGGSIDTKFSNAIKKGIMQKMMEGPLTGSPCRDIRVCIYDGKMHPVDSNDMAFQIAGSYAFRNNFIEANPQLLEPIYSVEILCSDDVMGDIMGDLQTRRAMIMGMDSQGHYQKIIAKVPLSEMYQYSSALRSISQGKAKFSRTFDSYQAVTPDIQHKIVSEYKELEEVG